MFEFAFWRTKPPTRSTRTISFASGIPSLENPCVLMSISSASEIYKKCSEHSFMLMRTSRHILEKINKWTKITRIRSLCLPYWAIQKWDLLWSIQFQSSAEEPPYQKLAREPSPFLPNSEWILTSQKLLWSPNSWSW